MLPANSRSQKASRSIPMLQVQKMEDRAARDSEFVRPSSHFELHDNTKEQSSCIFSLRESGYDEDCEETAQSFVPRQ
ncbi:hypothetical protein N7G274_000229 [Stereocaulon virgatum]|uniref:Uncharacterized protein n=1 Tax=Stereocaulon virgatum TaxID=373712 RepID=A0ABR4AT67_9LECA